MVRKAGTKATSVYLDEYRNRIRLRWRYQTIRFTIYVGPVNQEVIARAKIISQVISDDISRNRFDISLAKYKPKKQKKSPKVSTVPRGGVIELFNKWLRTTNMNPVPYNVQVTKRMVERWGLVFLEDIPDIFLNEKLHASTFNTRLNILRRFFKWLLKKEHVPINFIEDIRNKKNHAPKRRQRQPFEEEEVRRILQAYQSNEFSKSKENTHSHYFPFILFIFSTGVRNGEAVGLQVRKVDFKRGQITIDQSFSRVALKGTNIKCRVLKSTKTGTSRILPLTPALRTALAPLCKDRLPDDFVFTTKKGNLIDDNMFQRRIHKPILKGLNIEDRDLYACRHTFATMALEQNFSVIDAAYLMGHNNPKTIVERYAHLRTTPKRLPSFNFEKKDTTDNPEEPREV